MQDFTGCSLLTTSARQRLDAGLWMWPVLLAALFLVARPVGADTPENPGAPQAEAVTSAEQTRQVEAARAHFFRGVKYYEAGDFRWSLLEFRRAFELSQNYRILYNLARVSHELNQYADAIVAYEKYLRLGGNEIEAGRRAEVERDLDMLRARTARLQLTVNVDGAEIVVDNRAIGKSPLHEPIAIDAGEHHLSVRLGGYELQEKRIVAAAGDALKEEIVLRKATEAAPAGPPSQARASLRTSPASSSPAADRPPAGKAPMITWIGTGVLAAGAGVTGGLALMEANHLAELRDSPRSTPEERNAASVRSRRLALSADILSGAALAAGATALYFTIHGARQRSNERAELRLGVRPTRVTLTYVY